MSAGNKPPGYVLCVRFAEAKAHLCVAGAIRGQKCSECGEEVVMAASSRVMVEAGAKPLCKQCFDQWPPERQIGLVPTLAPGAVNELREWAKERAGRN